MKRMVERLYWWWMLKTSRVEQLDGLSFIYVSAAEDRPAEVLQQALVAAIDRIKAAGGGFGELVMCHLRFVAAIKAPRSWVATSARGYVSPFTATEVENAHYLACRLVWAATYVRLSHDAFAQDAARNEERIRQHAYEAQVRFTGQFPDSEKWLQYLARHSSGI